MTTPVSFELAKLLKEKGFDKECWNYYTLAHGKKPYITQGIEYQSDAKIKFDWNCNNKDSKRIQAPYPNTYHISQCSAPTIAEVVMWLYEKHGIWISVVPYDDEELSQTLWENKIIDIADDYNDYSDYTFYHSPTEAYEAVILYTLNNLI